jgi:AcrR family transcriptional regulator
MSPKPSSRDALLDATFLHVYRHGYHGAATGNILREVGAQKLDAPSRPL